MNTEGNFILYGDGVHDDTAALQAMIDTARGELCLPMPQVCYLICRPLELPSNFKLKLPRFAEVRLAAGSNCVMLKNRYIAPYCENEKQWLFFDIEGEKVAPFSENIEVEGGIWNFNNREQRANPISDCAEDGYLGVGMLFFAVRGLRLTSMTLKDPVTFAVTMDTVSYFTVDHIVFDFNYGNPLATNMDGIHLNGNCSFGHITDLKGACYDDMVALNADEGTKGPITDITIDGLYAEDCHSAVRLLSANYPVKNVHITNVYGTYYQYCIGITRFYPTADSGVFDGIALTNIYASKASRRPEYNKGDDYAPYVYPLIYVQDGLHVRGLRIVNLHRREYCIACPTVAVDAGTVVEDMVLQNVTVENHTDVPHLPLLENNGEIRHLHTDALYNDGKLQ